MARCEEVLACVSSQVALTLNDDYNYEENL